MRKASRQRLKKIISYIGIAIFIVCAVYIAYYRLSNPDMTKIRAFFNRWYIVLVAFSGMFLYMITSDNF